MGITELNNLSQFEQLKRGQQILVQWSNFFVRHHDKAENIMLYKIYKHKPEQNEIICRLKNNHYFNYKMFLGLDTLDINTSQAVKIYLIEESKQ